MDGYTIVTSDFSAGSHSVKVTNGAARQWITMSVGEGFIVEVSGHSKRVDATSAAPWDYSIYVDVAYSDNTYLWGQMAKFTVCFYATMYQIHLVFHLIASRIYFMALLL